MKHIYSLIILISFYSGFSQSLPINFEGDITTSDFVDFAGGTATVVPNPSLSGINTSSTVGQIVRDGETIFAGSKILLTDNLDFSVLTKISMKVYTTAPAGTVVKLKLENQGAVAADVNVTTTVSGTWETLEWILVGTPNTANEIVFMFDFGNIGDGSSTSTFYFDDVEQVAGPTAPVPTSLPIDFETGIVDTDFLNFNGSIASVISNPQIEGINTSSTVAQVVRNGGDFFAGSQLLLDGPINFTTLSQISMKIYTTAPVGTRIKLEIQGPNALTNLDYITTVSGTWEVASWNFYRQANNDEGQPIDYNKIQFLFDFGNVGDGTATSTFLFDDIQQVAGATIPEPQPTTLPIDFENNSVVTSDFTDFFGAITSVIPNPKIDQNNPSATVAQLVRSGGAGFMRSKLILTEPLPNMSEFGTISMKVYTEAPVGSILKFKLENIVPNAFGKEADALTTVSGEWATYTWDLSNADSPIYDVLTFMLGYNGSNDASPSATFLFDDIEIIPNSLSNGPDLSFNIDEIVAFPNPIKDKVTISSKNKSINNITIYNILGKEILQLQPNSLKTNIDISYLDNGIYIAKILTSSGIISLKLLKE
ncbi:T9SS type A sorting domain-containing protein [Winogradskyella sp. DF17]|uniref:T9SS type A sorting domain-containing protein n=1 Tax=Winogradskyella pelagia TaxID=2819984 RepID=A0ABS3T5I7_9FLAO|nr:T9SS type A sorting domain-containing protein [Winogradskyella sp. DF17]MBO3118019.1 T9SS type A sorting domain-containing protein [Winogradskyella sp. DF17]